MHIFFCISSCHIIHYFNLQLHNKIMQAVSLFLLLLVASCSSCDSTCTDQQCSYTSSPPSCSLCASNLQINTFSNECQAMSSLAVMQVINGSFTADSSTYVTSFIYNGSTYYSPTAFGSSIGLLLYQTTRNNLKMTLGNLPPHYSLDLRFSLLLSSAIYSNMTCPLNKISIGWLGGSYNTTVQPTTQVVNKTISHGSLLDEITLANLGDNVGGSCEFIALTHAAIIIALCPTHCLSCTAANTCDRCYFNQNSGDMYFRDASSNTCVNDCITNFYFNQIQGYGECNVCHPSCYSCSLPNVANGCTWCALSTPRLYLAHDYTCSQTCPEKFYPVNASSTFSFCQPCDPSCRTCSGSLANKCITCAKVNGTQLYLNSSLFCIAACPINYYSNPPNFECDLCDTACTQCNASSNNCQACASGFYLYSGAWQCVSSCPQSYYNNPQLNTTLNTYICSSCSAECLTCYGPSSNNCSSCTNILASAGTVVYFKQPNSDACLADCPKGFFANSSSNSCQACQNGCASCKDSAGYCFSCTTFQGVAYFLDSASNKCVTLCPNGSLGNKTNYRCQKCEYFTFEGNCLQSCPTGYAGVIADISTCVICSSSNTQCNTNLGFSVASKVINNGKSFEHIVALSQGLSPECTTASLLSGLSVSLVSGKRRLLLSVIPLTVQNLKISPDGSSIAIITNYYSADVTSSNVSISFKAGALISSSGKAYNQLTNDVSLSDPTFMYSYIQTFSQDAGLQAEGITFVLFSFVLLLVSAFATQNLKLQNQCMDLVQLIQIYGLSRIRPLPLSLDFYNLVYGFSHYELSFLPNAFSHAFARQYTQSSVGSIGFAIGTQNLILNFGSIIQVIIVLQLALLIFYLFSLQSEQRKAKFRALQEHLIVLWSVILIFGSVICMLSTEINDITSDNLAYAFSLLFAFAVFAAYCFYFAFWVRQHLKTQLFKLQSIFRVIAVLLMAYGNKFALVFLNIQELVFFMLSLSLSVQSKQGKVLLVVQKLNEIVILNATFMGVAHFALSVTSGVCFSILAAVKMICLFRHMFSSPKVNQQELIDQKPPSFDNQAQNGNQKKMNGVSQEAFDKKDLTLQNLGQTLQYSKLANNSSAIVNFDEKALRMAKNNIVYKESVFEDAQGQSEPVEKRVTVTRRARKLQPIEVKSSKKEHNQEVQIIQLEMSASQKILPRLLSNTE